MEEKLKVKTSKFMSLILRHDPNAGGITLDSEGWVKLSDVLKSVRKNINSVLTEADVRHVVDTNDKKRFIIKTDTHGDLIRANQGHSVDVDLKLQKATPPDVLYHGSTKDTLDKLYASGSIQKMKRHAVHLSKDTETATKVGSRHGKVILLAVDAKKMIEDGFQFEVSENGVWLIDNVPMSYVTIHV